MAVQVHVFQLINWFLAGGQVDPNYYAQVAITAASFVFSVLGVILDIVFICRKKTNLLMQLFVYLMVSSTIELGSVCLHYVFSIYVEKTCIGFGVIKESDLFSVIASCCLWVETVTVCFINVMLMTQFFNYMCASRSRFTCVSCRKNSHQKCMKAIFVTVLFSLPVLTIIGYVPIILLSNIYYVNSGLNQLVNFILQLSIVILVILNLLYNVALLIWFCWLRRRGVAGVITRKVLKETTLFSVLLFATLLDGVFILLQLLWTMYLVLTILSVFIAAMLPYLLLLYMWLRFRSSTRQVRITRGENRNLHINTTGLQTVPPSTRISLPSDTADHAPNFLSPSGDELSEVTPLLNNN